LDAHSRDADGCAASGIGATGRLSDRSTSGLMLSLSLDLADRYGVPSGVSGQAYVAVPLETPGIACAIPPPPSDVLRGPPADVLRGERGNLLNPAPQ
jgi:hypothetical protein